MAVGLWISLKGVKQEQYDAVNAAADVVNAPPEGLIFHSAGPHGDDWRVIDLWESRAHFDRFMESRLGPAISSIDNPPSEPPSIKEFEVYNFIKP